MTCRILPFDCALICRNLYVRAIFRHFIENHYSTKNCWTSKLVSQRSWTPSTYLTRSNFVDFSTPFVWILTISFITMPRIIVLTYKINSLK